VPVRIEKNYVPDCPRSLAFLPHEVPSAPGDSEFSGDILGECRMVSTSELSDGLGREINVIVLIGIACRVLALART
jgi:hypothetical protein